MLDAEILNEMFFLSGRCSGRRGSRQNRRCN